MRNNTTRRVALLGAGLLGLGVARGRRKVTFHGVTRGA